MNIKDIPKIDLSTPEMKLAFGPLPRCKHGLILCDICIELDRILAKEAK